MVISGDFVKVLTLLSSLLNFIYGYHSCESGIVQDKM